MALSVSCGLPGVGVGWAGVLGHYLPTVTSSRGRGSDNNAIGIVFSIANHPVRHPSSRPAILSSTCIVVLQGCVCCLCCVLSVAFSSRPCHVHVIIIIWRMHNDLLLSIIIGRNLRLCAFRLQHLHLLPDALNSQPVQLVAILWSRCPLCQRESALNYIVMGSVLRILLTTSTECHQSCSFWLALFNVISWAKLNTWMQ